MSLYILEEHNWHVGIKQITTTSYQCTKAYSRSCSYSHLMLTQIHLPSKPSFSFVHTYMEGISVLTDPSNVWHKQLGTWGPVAESWPSHAGWGCSARPMLPYAVHCSHQFCWWMGLTPYFFFPSSSENQKAVHELVESQQKWIVMSQFQ